MGNFPTKQEIINSRGSILTPDQLEVLRIRNNKIAEYKSKGMTYAEIAKFVNLSREYVKQICHKLGISGPQRKFIKEKKDLGNPMLF